MRDEDGKDPRCLLLQQIEYRRQTHAAARNSAGMCVQVFPVNLNTVGVVRVAPRELSQRTRRTRRVNPALRPSTARSRLPERRRGTTLLRASRALSGSEATGFFLLSSVSSV